MKVYLAARYGRAAELREYARELIEAGIEVTSSWLWDAGGEDRELSGIEQMRVAVVDYHDLARSDAVIAFTEPPESPWSRGGRHVEFGLALALEKKPLVIGPRENVFYYLPGVDRLPKWNLEQVCHSLTVFATLSSAWGAVENKGCE